MIEFCAICGKSFEIKPSHKKRFKGDLTCSRACRVELIREVYKGCNNPNHKYLEDFDKYLAIKLTDIKGRAKQNNLQFDLDHQFLRDLYLAQNGLCEYTGLPLKLVSQNFKSNGQADLDVMSLDRVLPDKGYTKGNVVLCCSAINKLKGSANPEELQSFISALAIKNFGTCRLKFKRVRPNTITPYRAQLGDGGHDLTAAYIEESETQIKVFTGISCEPSEGWVLMAFPRSSICKKGLSLANSIGLIDNNYRGEIMAIFNKLRPDAHITLGERIIQLVPLRIPRLIIEEVEELSTSERGEGGFGSSGR